MILSPSQGKLGQPATGSREASEYGDDRILPTKHWKFRLPIEFRHVISECLATVDYGSHKAARRAQAQRRRVAFGESSQCTSTAAHAHRLAEVMPDGAAPAVPGLIRIQPSSVSTAAPTPLHLLPCEIQHNGPAAVSRFFSPAIRPGPSGPVVSFRGRSLHGKEVTLPSGYVGLVLREEDKSEGPEASVQEDRSVQAIGTFSYFTFWGLETPPEPDARMHGALNWPRLATAIHAPVTEDDD
ncbi:ribonuclease H2 subunit C [Dromiciops gliroides]|uniref:ribonuclease H2 subunit C n=1 Tax=Dromiciops gliroides TaxID=33562 RepID=UPI001CC3D150|nr:ribonuclease H2 subunit C [Dromiciops gliroides]